MIDMTTEQLEAALAVVEETRRLHGLPAARAKWIEVGLPVPDGCVKDGVWVGPIAEDDPEFDEDEDDDEDGVWIRPGSEGGRTLQ